MRCFLTMNNGLKMLIGNPEPEGGCHAQTGAKYWQPQYDFRRLTRAYPCC